MDSQFRLKNESLFVLAEAPGGVYNAEQLRVVCDFVKSSSSFMKLTSEQSLGLMIEADGIPALQSQLAKVGLLLKPYRLPQTPAAKSCLGSLCPESQQDALGDAIALSEALSNNEALGQFGLGITLNGCSRSCVAGATDDVHLIAEETGYKISIGGRNAELAQLGQLVAENVAPEALPDMIGRILDLYAKERQDEESLFDTIERTGVGIFVEAASGNEPSPIDLMSELPSAAEASEGTSSSGESFASMTLPAPDLSTQKTDFAAMDAEAAKAADVPSMGAVLDGEDAALEPAVDMDFGHDTGSEPSFEFDLPQATGESALSGSSLLAGLPQPGQYDSLGNLVEDSGASGSAAPGASAEAADMDSIPAPAGTPHLKLALSPGDDEFISDLDGSGADKAAVSDEELAADAFAAGSFDADEIESADPLPPLADQGSTGQEAESSSISDIQLESFEDEFATDEDLAAQGLGSDAARFAKAMTDLDKPLASAISEDGAEALSAQQVNALLEDEGGLDLSDATDEDLNRVTQSIRSEAGFERDFERLSTETAKPYAPAASFGSAPAPAAAAPASSQQASGGTGRFRVRTAGGQLELNLPTGVELQIPLESFSEGAPFEMETEDGVVSIIRSGNVLKVKFGGLSMAVPMKSAA